jgi:hypothetical protein
VNPRRAASKGQWLRDLYGRHLLKRAMRRPLADVLGRSWNQHVRRLDTSGIAGQDAAGFWCEALLCRRQATHVVWFKAARRGGQVFDGEVFYCTHHARRYARRFHVLIEGPLPGRHQTGGEQ